eukprot:14149056-Alexandrium_andersonii.AAC.1
MGASGGTEAVATSSHRRMSSGSARTAMISSCKRSSASRKSTNCRMRVREAMPSAGSSPCGAPGWPRSA